MSQQHPGRRCGLGRRASSLLAPAVADGLLFLASSPPTQAAPTGPAARQPANIARQKYSAGTYVVQLVGKPVVTYGKTASAPGRKVNPRSQAVRDYLGRLKQARDQVLDEVRGVTPLYTYQYVLNGFSAKLTAAQAAALARTPGVVSLAPSEANHLAATATSAFIQYALPPGVTSQTYTLHTWLIGPNSPDHPATVAPATHPVSRGDTVPATVSWRNLPAGGVYLGLVGYGDGPDTVGTTVLTVTP